MPSDDRFKEWNGPITKDGKCANGCDRPVSPPSRVICRECQDKITEKLRKLAGVTRGQ